MATLLGGWVGLALAASAGVATPAAVRAQEGFAGWVGLFDASQVGWLENENRLGELCADQATLEACYARTLGPAVSVHSLYAAPDESARRLGDLVVVATPGRGLSAHVRPEGATQAIPFTPDLFLQDWGYGPYFHQTIAARAGDWFQLPRHPWPEAAWIRLTGNGPDPSVITVMPGDILELDGTGWFVIAAERDALVLRAEQPADLWCEGGEPPPLAPAEAVRLPRARLLDPDGHLRIRPKYLKGC